MKYIMWNFVNWKDFQLKMTSFKTFLNKKVLCEMIAFVVDQRFPWNFSLGQPNKTQEKLNFIKFNFFFAAAMEVNKRRDPNSKHCILIRSWPHMCSWSHSLVEIEINSGSHMMKNNFTACKRKKYRTWQCTDK